MVVNATDHWTGFILICYHTKGNRMIRKDLYTDKIKFEFIKEDNRNESICM